MEDRTIFEQLTKALTAQLKFIRQVFSIELFDCGSHCNIYKVTTETTDDKLLSLVVRLPRVDKQSRRMGMYREHVVLRYLENIGYTSAPRSFFHDVTLKYLPMPYSVQSFVDATPLPLNIERVRKLAWVIQTLHSVDISGLYEYGFSFYRTWHEGLLVEARHLGEWIHSSFSPAHKHNSWLLQLKPIMLDAWNIIYRAIEHSQHVCNDRAYPSLLHGDLGGHNFAWTGETPYLFDWELTSIGDPALDLAKLFRSELRDTTLKNEFLSAYKVGESKTPEYAFIERLKLYERIAALQTAIWAINILANNLDLQIYLSRNNFNQSGFIEFNVYRNLAYLDPVFAEKVQEVLVSGINNECA